MFWQSFRPSPAAEKNVLVSGLLCCRRHRRANFRNRAEAMGL